MPGEPAGWSPALRGMAALFRLEGRSFDLECLPTPAEYGEAVEQILGLGGWRVDLFDIMARCFQEVLPDSTAEPGAAPDRGGIS